MGEHGGDVAHFLRGLYPTDAFRVSLVDAASEPCWRTASSIAARKIHVSTGGNGCRGRGAQDGDRASPSRHLSRKVQGAGRDQEQEQEQEQEQDQEQGQLETPKALDAKGASIKVNLVKQRTGHSPAHAQAYSQRRRTSNAHAHVGLHAQDKEGRLRMVSSKFQRTLDLSSDSREDSQQRSEVRKLLLFAQSQRSRLDFVHEQPQSKSHKKKKKKKECESAPRPRPANGSNKERRIGDDRGRDCGEEPDVMMEDDAGPKADVEHAPLGHRRVSDIERARAAARDLSRRKHKREEADRTAAAASASSLTEAREFARKLRSRNTSKSPPSAFPLPSPAIL